MSASDPKLATDNDLVYLDLESTGLDTRIHDVTEAAWAVDDGPVRDTRFWHTLDHADPAALRISRYYERGLDSHSMPPEGRSGSFTTVQRDFIRDLTGATIVAENYGYDLAMLLRKLGFEPWHYRKIELSSVAMTVFDLDRPESQSSTANRLRDLGFTIPEADHSALHDVECLRACYLALRELRSQGLVSSRVPVSA